DLGLLLNLSLFARPEIGHPVVYTLACLLAQLLGEGHALLERAKRASERPAQIIIEREIHRFRRIGVPDVAPVVEVALLADLPHHTVALRPGRTERRPILSISFMPALSPLATCTSTFMLSGHDIASPVC